ncbi:hypothetical protein E4T39_03540 [Aureobasidium subglaciale]|nr:hypothetical protein E4T39_03540 [Aureobasidium subglaciale]
MVKIVNTAEVLWEIFVRVTTELGDGSMSARRAPIHPTGHWLDKADVIAYGKKAFALEGLQIMRTQNWLENCMRQEGIVDNWVLERIIAAGMEYSASDYDHLMQVFFTAWVKDLKPDGRSNRSRDDWIRWCEIHLVRHHRTAKAVRVLELFKELGLLYPGWWKQVFAQLHNTPVHALNFGSPWDIQPCFDTVKMNELNQKYARVPYTAPSAAPRATAETPRSSKPKAKKQKKRGRKPKASTSAMDVDGSDSDSDAVRTIPRKRARPDSPGMGQSLDDFSASMSPANFAPTSPTQAAAASNTTAYIDNEGDLDFDPSEMGQLDDDDMFNSAGLDPSLQDQDQDHPAEASEDDYHPEDFYPRYIHEYDVYMGRPYTTYHQLSHTVSFSPSAEGWQLLHHNAFDDATRYNPRINATRIVDSAAYDNLRRYPALRHELPLPPMPDIQPPWLPAITATNDTAPVHMTPRGLFIPRHHPARWIIDWSSTDERDFAKAVAAVEADFLPPLPAFESAVARDAREGYEADQHRELLRLNVLMVGKKSGDGFMGPSGV